MYKDQHLNMTGKELAEILSCTHVEIPVQVENLCWDHRRVWIKAGSSLNKELALKGLIEDPQKTTVFDSHPYCRTPENNFVAGVVSVWIGFPSGVFAGPKYIDRGKTRICILYKENAAKIEPGDTIITPDGVRLLVLEEQGGCYLVRTPWGERSWLPGVFLRTACLAVKF